MANPAVSVIIPTYNSANFIAETIESVLSQTYQDWEMLIVDDGSSDNTLLVARSYKAKDSRIKIFSLGHNSGGPATPRNYGIRLAQGDYIAFLDSDDLWLPQKLQKQIRFLEENEDIFLLYAQCIIQRGGEQLRIEPGRPKAGYIFNHLFIHFNIIDCLTVVMRNRREKNVYFFDEDVRLISVEDYAMWLSIALKEKISFLSEPMAIYRIHPNSISCDVLANFGRCRLVLKKFCHLVPLIVRMRAYFNFYAKLIFIAAILTLKRLKNLLYYKGCLLI